MDVPAKQKETATPQQSSLDALTKRRLRQKQRLDQFPYMSSSVLPDRELLAELRELRSQRHLAATPFPFDGMFAVTSDIDMSNRDKFGAYTAQLNGEFGLDFGDSVWLSNNRVGPNPGMGMLGPDLRTDPETVLARAKQELDIYEIADGIHSGLVDHWHSFLTRGPRAFLLRRAETKGDELKYQKPPEPEKLDAIFGTRPSPIFAASMLVRKSVAGKPAQVTLRFKTDPTAKWLARYEDFVLAPETDAQMYPVLKKDFGDWNFYLFTADPGAESDNPLPQARSVEFATVNWSDGAAPTGGDVPTLILHNFHSRLLLDRIRFVHDEFGVRLSLLSTHALWFLVRNTEEEMVRWRAETENRASLAEQNLYALPMMFEKEGEFFTTMGDDVDSFCRAFPELIRDYGIRHYRVAGPWHTHDAPEEDLAVTDDLTYPMQRRDGGVLLNVQSSRADIPAGFALVDPVQDRKTTAISFPPRLQQFMLWFDAVAKKSPPIALTGRGVFFYTHVGNQEPTQNVLPTPYFDPATLSEWRDRFYGTNFPKGDGKPRIWFTRASVLADFALINQLMIDAAAVEPEKNTVTISSVTDPLLDVRLPECKEMLYGQTFFVTDGAQAVVTFDGKRIWDVQCNPSRPIEGLPASRLESITIATCGIRKVIFDEIDPLAGNRPEFTAKPEGISWQWQQNGEPLPSKHFGRMTLSKPDGALRLDFQDFKLMAAQQLFYSLRRHDPSTLFGIEWEVADGSRFFAGDKDFASDLSSYAAYYLFDQRWRAPNVWRRYVVPFYAMQWNKAGAAITLPSHPFKSMRLMLRGPSGASVDIDELELGKPRTTRPTCGDGLAIVGGKVAKGVTLVKLRAVDGTGADFSCPVDDYSGFRFKSVPHGGYRLSWQRGTKDKFSERDIEVKSDRFDLRLE